MKNYGDVFKTFDFLTLNSWIYITQDFSPTAWVTFDIVFKQVWKAWMKGMKGMNNFR